MRAYADTFAAPHAKHLVISNLIGRLPNGMGAIAIVLFLRAEGASYQIVGLLSALYAVTAAIGSPILGRLVDRRGQPTVLVISGVGSALGFALLASVGGGHAVLAGIAVALAGFFTPPLEPCLRSLWPNLLSDPESVNAAYAFDAAAQEVIFVTGPLLVIGSIDLGGERFALWCTGVVAIAGTLAFVSAPPVRSWRAELRETDWAGPLRSETLRILLVALLCIGAAVGTLSLLFSAYAERVQRPSWAGLLLGAHALGGLAGGLAYGAISWIGSTRARLTWLFAGLSLGYFPLALMFSPVPMLGLAVLSGVFLAPVMACSFVVVGEVAPKGTTTEAFAWIVTIFTAGTAIGAAVSGILLQNMGLAGAFLLPGLFCTAAASVLLVARRFRVVAPRVSSDPPRCGVEPVPATARRPCRDVPTVLRRFGSSSNRSQR